MRRLLVLILVVVPLATLTGCTAFPGGVPQATVQATVPVVREPVTNGDVGRGALVSWNGKTSGNLTVVARSGKFSFTLSDFVTDATGTNLYALADNPVTMSDCGEKNLWQVGLTTLQGNVVQPTMRFDLPNIAGAFTDPSFFKYFLIMQSSQDATPIRGCQQSIVALTRIEWTMPHLYPRLVVVDSGAVRGAEGTVTEQRNRPFTYTTAAGDVWATIARRMSLTPDELLYLNPIRHPEAEPAIAYAGQILNLEPNNRGNSESRRPGAQ